MRLTISPKAVAWFEEELDLAKGDSVKIYGKYGGSTNVHIGFSTGIELADPLQPLFIKEVNGINFFTESDDEWFFLDYHLMVDIDDKLNEPTYTYQ